jgi:hypothetical protein
MSQGIARYGDVMVAAVAGDVGGVEGVDAFEEADTLAGGAFADLQAIDDVVEGEGLFAGEEEAVDLAVGSGRPTAWAALTKKAMSSRSMSESWVDSVFINRRGGGGS